MKKVAIASAALLALALTGCSTTSEDAQDIPDCMRDGSKAAGCQVTIQYKDYPIDCITWQGSHGETGLNCDFVAYHEEH